jgi:hypothetical protein
MNLSEAYAVLGVPSTADLKEIKAAYRKRAIETHPDKGGNAKEFIRVRAAHEIVCSFLQSPDIDNDLPIPDDLRAVIADIVRDFRSQFQQSETMCADAQQPGNYPDDRSHGHIYEQKSYHDAVLSDVILYWHCLGQINHLDSGRVFHLTSQGTQS